MTSPKRSTADSAELHRPRDEAGDHGSRRLPDGTRQDETDAQRAVRLRQKRDRERRRVVKRRVEVVPPRTISSASNFKRAAAAHSASRDKAPTATKVIKVRAAGLDKPAKPDVRNPELDLSQKKIKGETSVESRNHRTDEEVSKRRAVTRSGWDKKPSVSREQAAAAARIRLASDEKSGRSTADWIVQLAKDLNYKW